MQHQQRSLKDAYVYVKERRRFIGPHYYLKLQLLNYEHLNTNASSMSLTEWSMLEDEMREEGYYGY